MREVDLREAPDGWPYGFSLIGTASPNTSSPRPNGNVFALNSTLTAWAYQQTKDPSFSTIRMLSHCAPPMPVIQMLSGRRSFS